MNMDTFFGDRYTGFFMHVDEADANDARFYPVRRSTLRAVALRHSGLIRAAATNSFPDLNQLLDSVAGVLADVPELADELLADSLRGEPRPLWADTWEPARLIREVAATTIRYHGVSLLSRILLEIHAEVDPAALAELRERGL